MGDDGNAGALHVVIDADSHSDAALSAGEGGGNDIALIVGLDYSVNGREGCLVVINVRIIRRFEDCGIGLSGLDALLLSDLILGDKVNSAENARDDRADKEQNYGELNYLIHYAPSFAAFFAALAAARSSLVTPNCGRQNALSIAHVQRFMISIP